MWPKVLLRVQLNKKVMIVRDIPLNFSIYVPVDYISIQFEQLINW